MSFTKKNLERLRQLESQLNQGPSPSTSNSNKRAPKKSNSFMHPIETEEDPEALFRELIKASPDGQVPDHLISRLKEMEAAQISSQKQIPLHKRNNSTTTNKINEQLTQRDSKKNINSDQESLYTSFHSLLLEEEEDL